MSAFKTLFDVSRNFEKELRKVSDELYSVRIADNFEDTLEKKLRDLTLLKTKLKLLRAKPLSLNPQITNQNVDKDTALGNYSDALESRIIEELLLKSGMQAQAVKALLTTPQTSLEPEMVERRDKIIAALTVYQTQEAMVQHLDIILRERENQLTGLRREWDNELSMLKDMKQETAQPSVDVDNPLYQRMSGTVRKLQMMCWLAGRLGAPRSRGYDWLSDPHGRLKALKIARRRYSVDTFLQETG